MIQLIRTFSLGLAAAVIYAGAASAETTFDSLSTGNQKIVNAIHDAQTSTEGSPDYKSLDQIALTKDSGGWGKTYNQMYADGLVEYRNLGQAISSYNHANKPPPSSSTSTTVITTGSGQKITVGGNKPGHFGKSLSKGAKSQGGKKSFSSGKGANVTVTTAGGSTHGSTVSSSAKHGGGSGVGVTSAGGGGHGYGHGAGKSSGKGK